MCSNHFTQTLLPKFTLCQISNVIFESCGATYKRICEMFSAIQSPVTDVENSVQIDA